MAVVAGGDCASMVRAMTADDLLGDYGLKRARAMHHLDILRGAIEQFTREEVHFVPGELNADGTEYVFDVPLRHADPEWATIVGDFAFNRRASLDYLITALVRSAGNQESGSTEFPIYGAEPARGVTWENVDEWWENDRDGLIRRKLADTPPATKAALKELQPFYGVPMADPVGHPLAVLQALNNRDKHRRLNLLARNATIDFTDARRQPIFDGPPLDHRIAQSDEGGAYRIRLMARVTRDIDVHILTSHDVVFGEPPELIENVVETLFAIDNFVELEVVPRVRRLL